MFPSKTILIIPTKDRPKKISKTLTNIIRSKIKFKKILVIDSSRKYLSHNVKFYKSNKINYIISKPSISIQRNIGINYSKKLKNFKYIMFLDDDILIFKNSFIAMDLAIKRNSENKKIAGFIFSNSKKNYNTFFENLKNSKISKYLNLYDDKPGKVLDSGWQTKLLYTNKDIYTEWTSFAAVIFKLKYIKNKKFDESFGQYSYLEDLDMSLQFKSKNFLLVASAKYFHMEEIERKTFEFGKYEFLNRFKIVKKHNLSKISFFKMVILKMSLNFSRVFIGDLKFIVRFAGNIYAIIFILFEIIKYQK